MRYTQIDISGLKAVDHCVYDRFVMWPQANVKLSGGPHGRSPAEVKQIQRERLLKATCEVVSRKGYAAATVRDLLAQSGLSRRTYYDLYTDKEDCYLDAFGEVAKQIEERIGAAFDYADSPRDRVRLALEALIDFCVAEIDAACACLVESLAAGAAGREARSALIERVAATFAPALAEMRPADPNPALIARATIGGIFELLYGPLARQDVDKLRDLADQIGELPLVMPPEG
jgi:AcrR family transcriptional regulator